MRSQHSVYRISAGAALLLYSIFHFPTIWKTLMKRFWLRVSVCVNAFDSFLLMLLLFSLWMFVLWIRPWRANALLPFTHSPIQTCNCRNTYRIHSTIEFYTYISCFISNRILKYTHQWKRNFKSIGILFKRKMCSTFFLYSKIVYRNLLLQQKLFE